MSKTLTNQQKKDWAKMLYMQGELQSRQIAEKVGVSPVTMSKWSKEGNWEMLRRPSPPRGRNRYAISTCR